MTLNSVDFLSFFSFLSFLFFLSRVCRNLNSWGCRLWCAMPDGMMTDAQGSVRDAQQCSKV